ncbi:MAG: 16S rRNA (uracil(1498)-N(3))-methyltransferase [Saprospiraceae bacterium]|nr:16S rRNA (uracil(1498)-N(3))-methyltransferase [Saprospiraceae bacterium]
MHYYYAHKITDDVAILSESEVQHITKSMRMHDGDEIWVLDGKGSKMRCRLQVKGKKEVVAWIQERIVEPVNQVRLHLAIAPTKNPGRLEWLVEKVTELGVGQITFLNTGRSERTKINLDRIRKIAISALKQSGNSYLPVISDVTSLDHFFRLISLPVHRFIAHCQSDNLPLLTKILTADEEAVVMIGPEGDFTTNEIAEATLAGFRPISLGKLRLRTETAGIFVTSMVAILNKF